MASNFSQERKIDKESSKAGGLTLEDGDSKKQLLSASSTATSKQNGDQAGCEDEQMSEQDASERRKAGLSDLKNCGGSPSTLPRSAEELPRRNFQIPRKIKERKGLLQHLSPESREFEEVVKLLSTFYLDATSRGTFTYTKASLIHNELLEKEFIEKKRELKQNGRTEAELAESYAFLLPERNKAHWICEKGLSVGHSRINNLGSPVKGVYLSKYSDLLQMNPFEVGAAGDIIIFKTMKGKVKTIFDNMPKNNLEPTLKYDSHVFKNASKVTSLLSYRAFEHTQQYFYEFAFEELKSRPRHVLPYAVVSFQYKGKESATATHSRLNSTLYEGQRVRRRYTLWSGSLVNKGEEVYQVYMRSSSLPHLPLKLPDKLDINTAMHLDQVKRKIPPILLSWEAYSGSREAFKCGMYCSLYEVMGRSKQENSLSGLMHRLERERMVLVKPLIDKGFLFLLSSSQLHTTTERRGRNDRVLQALFVFQEQRITSKLILKNSGVDEDLLVPLEPKDPISHQLDNFIPALHHGLYKLRANPPKELAAGLKHQVLDYLNQKEQGVIRPFHIVEYRHSLDDRTNQHQAPRPKNMDVALNSYIFGPVQFQLPVEALQQGLMDSQQGAVSPPAGAEEYSPVSDWGGSDRQAPGSSTIGVSQSNGGAQRSQGEYDKEKMEKLLKLIQLHKRTLGKEEGSGSEREEDWDPAGLKRRLEREGPGGVSKYLRTGLLNGEPGRVVMDSMGLCDTDLRERMTQSPTLQDTHALLKLFLSTLNRMAQNSTTASSQPAMLPKSAERHDPSDSAAHCDLDLRGKRADEEQVNQDYLEEQMACSRSSMDVYSPSSSLEQQPSRQAEASHQSHHLWRTSTREGVGEPCSSGGEKLVHSTQKVVDTILNSEFQNLCTGIQKLMEDQHIIYNHQPPLPRCEDQAKWSSSAFSPFVSKYVSSMPVQSHVNTLCEKMNHLIRAPRASVQPVAVVSPPAVAPVPAPLLPAPPTPAMPAPAQPTLPSPPAHPHTKTSSPVPKSQALSSKPQATLKPPPSGKNRLGTVKEVHLFSAEKSADHKSTDVVENPMCSPLAGSASQPPVASVPEITSEPTHAGTSSTVGGSVLGQIKPDVLCTLMEIMQKNAVKFYIQRGDEESELCTEIKEYLRSLGNIDCNPQNYLESKSQQKFMIIIQNEDIAAHVHKIPALVSLKKLPTVYFAGVDSLDDVKNRTYNELFVSGGLIVSDELVLNPDSITLEKLQAFLKFLEEQGSPWKWKVHCKTQKKLKELSRLNTEALDLLNLLTTYQKKHLVEFLPYHECDTPSRQAPDLDCLVKLQAQHTQLRHLIFLTEKHDETFSQFSGSGVIVAGMNDIMNNFQSLITVPEEVAVAALPEPVEPDAVRDEEDMSIDSEDDMPIITEMSIQTENELQEPQAPQPPPPQTDGFRPPLPDQPCVDPISDPLVPPNPSAYPTQSFLSTDYAALKSAIAQYKAASQESTSRPDVEDTLASFGVNPHQSYLCPSSAQWSPYSGSPAYHMSSAYSSPVSVASRGSEYSQAVAPPGIQPPTNTSTIPVAQPLTVLLSLPQPPVSSVEVPSIPESATSLQPPGLSLPIPDSVGVPGAAAASTANQLGLAGSQTAKIGVESASSSTASSSSSLHTTFPSYPDTTLFPALTPIPPVPPLFGWGPTPGAQQGYAAGQSGAGFGALPSTQTEAARPADGLWVGATESETARGQEEEGAPTSATSKVVQQEAGGEKRGALGSSTSCGQGSRTPVNSSSESQGGSQAPPTRGGTASRGLLPIPGAAMGALCRGGHNNSMYNPRGGHPDMMRGGFRGRGVPPHPMRSRPGRGHMRGGPSCNWGYPPGRGGGGRSDYYSDYTYN
ncbi:protein TASOR isoform X2 [Sinocyclocheilus rhinocerous]|uniref:protein TASOR isoform X2 n=1 Tax=Sinocyclocheilus rhinocerous TaxID=307959 RepID=UPI0007B926AA|nr:PREDICTED: protein TASOR-like isoform X2 [Sinocyclocheilus rhinocerous]